jgi:hypothetical protein
MTAQEKHEAKLEEYLSEVGLKAVMKHPKAKLYAKVNHADNFALVMYNVAEQEIMDDVGMMFDKDSNPRDVDWWNKVSGRFPNEHKSKFCSFVNQICLTAYEKLRK